MYVRGVKQSNKITERDRDVCMYAKKQPITSWKREGREKAVENEGGISEAGGQRVSWNKDRRMRERE